ncbi:MAG: thiamine phosphate synthase [Armatimonadota bacterium]|nr:thiamine phosphate synthase [Armatimonadota bacterium]
MDSTVSLPRHLLRARLRGLYVITDERMGGGHSVIARAALAGGAAIIQLRDKSSSLPRLLETARELRRLTRSARALFIINDRVDVALAVQADGVHLGPDDMPLAEARRVLGPHRLIGASCGDVEEARRAERAGADYIGAGAIFGTATKHDAGAPIGLEALRAIVAATTLPVAAIGGVNRDNIAAVMAAGADMACVVSAVASAGNESAMTAATRDLIEAAGFNTGLTREELNLRPQK